jgi:hypothetical protein
VIESDPMTIVTALVISWLLLLPLVLLSAGWAARDANDIGLTSGRTLLALPPAVLFVVVALFWPLTFPWYLVTRAKVRAGTLPRRKHAPSTNGFAPVTPVGALSSTVAGGDGQGSAVLVEQAADEGDAGVIKRRPRRESWTAVGRVLGVLLALLCTGFVGYACAIDSLFEPVKVVAIRDDGEVGIVPVSGRWLTTSLPDRWSPIASAVEFYAACRNPEFEAELHAQYERERARSLAYYEAARAREGNGTVVPAATDTKPSTLTVVLDAPVWRGIGALLLKNERATVTFTFDEPVKGFSLDDVVAENADLSPLSTTDNIRFTATMTPRSGIVDATNRVIVENTGYVDAAGNSGTGTETSENYAIDTVAIDTRRPTLTVSVDDGLLLKNETTTVTFTFDEPVKGFSVDDVVAENAELSPLSTTDNIRFTATMTPRSGIVDATNTVTVSDTGYVDAADNAGTDTALSNTYAIDTEAPHDPLRRRRSFDSCRQHGLYRAGDSSMNARHPYGAHDQNLTFSGRRVHYNEWAGKDGGISTDEYDVIGRQVRPLRHNRVNVMLVFVLLPGLPFTLWIAVMLLRPILGGLAGVLYDRRQRDQRRSARL